MLGSGADHPECPVDAADKEWIDTRMEWLVRHFGWDQLFSAEVILPTPEFFPDDYHGTVEDASVMLDRVCEYMVIDPERVKLEVYEDSGRAEAADAYDFADNKNRVRIEAADLDSPLILVATMARELARAQLRGRAAEDEEDFQALCDLVTVFFGLGVFTANSVLQEKSWEAGALGYWTMRRRGQLTMAVFGYALALFAWSRREHYPPWANELRTDVRTAFDQGLMFLSATDEQFGRRDLPPSSEAIQSVPANARRGRPDRWARADFYAGSPPGARCKHCEGLLGRDEGPVCRECLHSILENDRERALEKTHGDKITRLAWKIFLGAAVLFATLSFLFFVVDLLLRGKR